MMSRILCQMTVSNRVLVSFDKLYHLEGVKLDEHLCEVLKWKK